MLRLKWLGGLPVKCFNFFKCEIVQFARRRGQVICQVEVDEVVIKRASVWGIGGKGIFLQRRLWRRILRRLGGGTCPGDFSRRLESSMRSVLIRVLIAPVLLYGGFECCINRPIELLFGELAKRALKWPKNHSKYGSWWRSG